MSAALKAVPVITDEVCVRYQGSLVVIAIKILLIKGRRFNENFFNPFYCIVGIWDIVLDLNSFEVDLWYELKQV